MLHHDNARSYTAQATQERIKELQREHPPYSPDLAPSDFHISGLPKNHLGSKCFADDEEVEVEVQKWLKQQSKISMLWVSMLWQSDGTNLTMLVEDISRNKSFYRFKYHILYVTYPFMTISLTLPLLLSMFDPKCTICFLIITSVLQHCYSFTAYQLNFCLLESNHLECWVEGTGRKRERRKREA
jgi:hypothetical protein